MIIVAVVICYYSIINVIFIFIIIGIITFFLGHNVCCYLMHTGIHFWQHQRACKRTCYWTLIRIFLFFPFFPSYLLPSILSSSSSISYSSLPSRYANSPFLLPPFLFFLPPSPRFPLPQHLHPLFSFLTFKLTFFFSLFAPFSPTLCTVQAAHRILTKANISYVNSGNKEAKEEKGKKRNYCSTGEKNAQMWE